jgi:hypothetical protein
LTSFSCIYIGWFVSWILIALDMPLHSDTFLQFWANQSLLLLLSVVYLVEKQQICWPRIAVKTPKAHFQRGPFSVCCHIRTTVIFRWLCVINFENIMNSIGAALWVWIMPKQGVLDTTLYDKVCKYLTSHWISLVSFTNKTDRYARKSDKKWI